MPTASSFQSRKVRRATNKKARRTSQHPREDAVIDPPGQGLTCVETSSGNLSVVGPVAPSNHVLVNSSRAVACGNRRLETLPAGRSGGLALAPARVGQKGNGAIQMRA